MELCDDCRRIKIARLLKGLQKFDKHVLTSRDKQFTRGFLESLSHAGRSTFASLEWMSWWIHGPGLVGDSRIRRDWPYKPLGDATGVVVAELGSRLRQSPLKNCDFCNLLANIRIPARKRYISAYRDGEDVLVACRYFKDPGRGQRWDHEGTPSDIVVMAVVSSSQWTIYSTIQYLTRSMERSEPRGFLTCRLKDSKSDVSQSAQAPQPAIDFSEISRLIQNCQQSHRDCQNRTMTSRQPIPICLIDCHSRELIQTTSSESYVALSYVWGGVSAGTLDDVTLPRTLEDAIQVTQSLGFKYIWIDQFCVNQHDNAIKHKQIRTMGMVYADAAVTLVAASGSDANHGLPGAPNHPFPGKGRHSVVMDGCIISEEAAPIDVEIQNSVWTSRGWTFQEQFFSRRFLVFSLGQVSYECRRVKYSPRHGTIDSSAAVPLQNRHPGWASLWSRLHDRNTGQLMDLVRYIYYHLVAQYWPRHLSLDTDGVNAITAILEHLKNLWDAELLQKTKKDDVGRYGIAFTSGMPHLIRHNAESPDPDLEVFVTGLVWYCDSPTKRREGFPSWCWAGWIPLGTHAKSIEWEYCRSKGTPLISNVFFRSSPDTKSSSGPRHHKRTLQQVPLADHKFSSVPEILMFGAPVLPPSAISWYDRDDEPHIWDKNTNWSLADSSVLKRVEFLGNLANRKYCLIALWHEENTAGKRFAFLLVRQVDQYRHERIGLVMAWPDDVSWAQCNQDLELRTWELI